MSIKVLNTVDRAYDVFIVPKFEGEVKLPECITGDTREYLTALLAKKEFTGKKGTHFKAEVVQNGKVSKIVYIGMGKTGELDKKALLNAYYKVFRRAKGEIVFIAKGVCAATVAESFLYSLYDFDTYKSEKCDHAKTLTLVTEESEAVIREVEAVVEGVNHTRQLVNEPANVIYPETLARYAVNVGKASGFEVDVYDEEYIEELKMHAFLAVAQASRKRPKLIVMRYFGAGKESSEVLGLVGKGLTYDTGGLCIKPPEGMKGMKDDMGGSATVIGVMSAIAKMGIKKNVIAVVAACENAIGGNAIRPGDIISSMKGISIEVDNTDAEGRLTLADAVYYAITKEKVTEVIDVATLTGAAVAALGQTTTAVVTNSPENYKKLEAASIASAERVWQMPNFPEYKDLFKSKVADLKNSGGRFAGCIVAAMFIEAFVEQVPWLHLDIAGSVIADSPRDYYVHGGTGEMVRTLYTYIKNN